MQRDKATAWLKLLGCKVAPDQVRAEWVVSDCPLGPWRHDQGKSGPEVFGLKIEPGDSFTNCFSCGWHGSQGDLLMRVKELNTRAFVRKFPLGDLLEQLEDAADDLDLTGLTAPGVEEMLFSPKEDKVHAFPEQWLAGFPRVAQAPAVWDYLDARHVGPDVAAALDLRYDPGQARVCFPVRDFSGLLVGLHGRAVSPAAEPRYRMYLHDKRNNPEFWLGESWVDLERPLVVVEGPFDVASVLRVYRNVASPLYAVPSFEKLWRMRDAMKVVTLFDSGTGGDKGRVRAGKAFKDSEVVHLQPPGGAKDPGEMTEAQLREVLGPHVRLAEETS